MGEKTSKIRLWAVIFWLAVWQLAAMGLARAYPHGSLLLASPAAVLYRLGQLAVTTAFWQAVGWSAARIFGGFLLSTLLAVLLVLTVLPGMVNIYHLHSAETLLHPWLSTSYDQLVPDWWQRLYPITYYFLGGYLRAHVDIKRLRTGRLAALLLLAVLCFGGYNVWRNQGIPFVWGSWCD